MGHSYLYSYVLSQVFGIYLFIMAIVFACRVDYYRNMINNIKPDSFGLLISGSSGLLFGIFLVTIHTVRGHFAIDLLTVIFWLILLKSILVLAFPEHVIETSKKLYSGIGYYVAVVIWALLGIVLMANGYYLYM